MDKFEKLISKYEDKIFLKRDGIVNLKTALKCNPTMDEVDINEEIENCKTDIKIYKTFVRELSDLKDECGGVEWLEAKVTISVSLFDKALKLMRDLAEHQNGAPLIRHEEEYNKTMTEVWDFLEANET